MTAADERLVAAELARWRDEAREQLRSVPWRRTYAWHRWRVLSELPVDRAAAYLRREAATALGWTGSQKRLRAHLEVEFLLLMARGQRLGRIFHDGE